MCTPSGNSEFCFPSSLNVSVSTLRLSGKQNSLFPSGAHINCILYGNHACRKTCSEMLLYELLERQILTYTL